MELLNTNLLPTEHIIRVLEERDLNIPNLRLLSHAELVAIYDKIKPLPQRKLPSCRAPSQTINLTLETDYEMEGCHPEDQKPKPNDGIESLDFQKIRINSPSLMRMWTTQALGKRLLDGFESNIDVTPIKKHKPS